MKEDTNLDVLRSMAVLSVLALHISQLYPGKSEAWDRWGRFGVLVFFVHTSLVLMMSLDRLVARQAHLPQAFYVQRIFRIYPLSILCVLVVLLCRLPEDIYTLSYVRPSAAKIICNLLLIQNTGIGSVSGPLWSLPYEVQMYAALPFLYWYIKRRPNRIWMAGLIVFSIGCGCLQLISPFGKVAQFFPCFMGGILAYWLRRRERAVLPVVLWPIWILVLGSLFAAVAFFGASFAVCLVLGATLGCFQRLPGGFASEVAHQIAKYSYGIYLAHVPLLQFCFHMLPVGSQTIRWILFSLLLPIIVVALYHGVEFPFIQMGKRLTANWHTRPKLGTLAAGAGE